MSDSAVTMRDLRRWCREGRKFPVLTCYDATSARWLVRGGVRALLVGDSAAQMVLGEPDTLHAPLEFMLAITAGVKRGAPESWVLGDLPFGSYQASDEDAVRNACRFMSEGRADAVKLEVDGRYVKTVARVARAGVPVVAHLGWRPQRVHQTGVAVVAGRTDTSIAELVELAKSMVSAGASALLLEACTAEAGLAVVEAVGVGEEGGGRGGGVPVIGCGAGPSPHGHVVILQDWLGMTDWQPSFAPPHVQGGQWLADAARAWADEVESGRYLAGGGPFRKKSGSPEVRES